MNSILLIEDESSVSSFIRKGLAEDGYQVSAAFSGDSGIEMAAKSAYDIIILDIMLPERNGIDVCRELRSRRLNVPILFLTALGTAENIALGLDSGGDDYLVKPFKFIELKARIKALLRRTELSVRQGTAFTIADLKVDDASKTVERGGLKISLTATEYRLLMVLLRNKGRVLSRSTLLEAVWDVDFDLGTNVVDVYINYLRKKLDVGKQQKLIHTMIGMGYVLREE